MRNNAIRKITPFGAVTTFIKNSTLLPMPSGIIIDKCDNIIVISDGVKVILISPDGIPTHLAGGTSGLSNGPGVDARFDGIHSMVKAKDGTIYVPDQNNQVIRQITF